MRDLQACLLSNKGDGDGLSGLALTIAACGSRTSLSSLQHHDARRRGAIMVGMANGLQEIPRDGGACNATAYNDNVRPLGEYRGAPKICDAIWRILPVACGWVGAW